MSKTRTYCYNGQKFGSMKCRRCNERKPIWYFGISSKTGERRKTCKACRARLKQRVRVDNNKRFEGVFDGLDLNPLWDLNSNGVAQEMIDRRSEAVRVLIMNELREKNPKKDTYPRTIADEIQAGKKAWRAIHRLARAPMPLNLPEAI